MKQLPNESLRQYKQRFELTVAGIEELGIKAEPEKMLTARFVKGLSEDKHRDFKTWLSNLTATVGKEQYPSTLEEAVRMITSFEAPRASYRAVSGVAPAVFTAKAGATASTEPKVEEKKSEEIKKKETRSCRHCGKKGHLVKDCWQLTRATAMLTTEGDGDSDDVILDNGATIHVYNGRAFVDNVRRCAPLTVTGLSGVAECGRVGRCVLTGLSVLIAEDTPMNILSMSKLKDDGFIISYDDGNDSFSAVKRKLRLTFERQRTGLYTLVREHQQHLLIATVKDNEGSFTANEVSAAKEVLNLMRRLGAPSVVSVKELLNSGVLGHATVSPRDVDNAVKIYGAPLANLKGKAKEPNPIKTELCKAPKANVRQVELFVDLFFWDESQYCVCVVKPIGLIMTTYLGDAKKPKSGGALLDTIRFYKDSCRVNGYVATRAYADGERGLKAVATELLGMGIELIPMDGSHVGVVEVSVRTVKEQARGILHTLPYRLPKTLQKDLIAFVTQRINLLPSKRGYTGMPAIQAFTGIRVNLDQEARVAFGEYCQTVTPNLAATGRKNDIGVARTEGGIALSNANRHGHVIFFCLRTHSRIVRTKWKVLPMSGELILMINRLSMPDALIVPAQEKAVEEAATIENVDEELLGDSADVSADVSVDVNADVVAPVVTIEDGIGLRRSARAARVDYAELANGHKVLVVRQLEYCLNMSIKMALKKFGESASDSIRTEVNNLIDKGVLQPVHFDFASGEKLVDCFMFIKEKLKPTGELDKIKARIVANERKQFVFTDEQTSSPTATTTSLFIAASLALARNWHVCTADFVAAYLNAEGGNQAMRVSPEITAFILQKKPEWKEFVTKKGGLVVRLKKALYGCSESAKRWYELLTETLKGLGYRRNTYDECVFISQDAKVILCVYVDDMFITAESDGRARSLERELLSIFPAGVNFKHGDNQDYVGMHIEIDRVMKQVHVSMEDYTRKVCEAYGVHASRSFATPACADLFNVDENEEKLDVQYQDVFHSTVAAALYLGKHARPDILLTVSALSSRVNKATGKDKKGLERLIAYLASTKHYLFALSCFKEAEQDCVIKCYVDASFAIHHDGKSHTGVFVTLGTGGIYFKSTRQKIVCKSAWEAELVAQSDSASQAVWTYNFCNELGAGRFRVLLLCDNLGTIASIKKGKPSNDKSRHVHVRYFWMKQLLENPDFDLQHCGTDMMIADLFTKPLVGETFIRLADMAMGHSCGTNCLQI
jgi:hypothetical protein